MSAPGPGFRPTQTWCKRCGRDGAQLKVREVYRRLSEVSTNSFWRYDDDGLGTWHEIGTLCAYCGYTWIGEFDAPASDD